MYLENRIIYVKYFWLKYYCSDLIFSLYFHTNPKELTPESITKFLEGQEGVKDDFARPHKLCVNQFNFQRKGRDETLHKIYDCIVKRYISIKKTLKEEKSVGDKSLHPVLALQATPGGGKSFLLDELAALKSKDFDNYLKSKERPNRKCPFNLENVGYHKYIKIVNNVIDMLRNSIVVCITYNGNSTYKDDSFVDANVQRGLVMRILWSYFFDDAKLTWQRFHKKFGTNFGSLDIDTAVESILYHSKKRVFLCIDETLNISPDAKCRQDKINVLLNNLYSPYQGLVNDKGELIKFNFILTTLDAVYVQTNTTYSGRKIDWVPLRRLEISESTDLFHKILNDNELKEKRKYLIKKCISDCNGHPRTLEKFYELLSENKTALDTDMYSSLLSHLVDRIVSSSFTLSYLNFSVIKTALLGNSTSLTCKINTLNGEFSIKDLISMGVYINSLTEVEETINVVPTLTLISIRYFCKGNEEGDAKIAVEILKDILYTECYFDGNVNDGKPFESFHCNWEQLYRVLREEGKKVSLREVYRLSNTYNTTTKGDVEIMLQRKKIIRLDRSVEFPPLDGKICDEQGNFIKNFEEYIFVPEKTNNSGFDMTIFEKKVGGGHIALNIECRFSYPKSSTTLTSKEIRDKYDLMKDKYRYHVKREKKQIVTREQRKNSEVELINSDTPIGELGMTMEDIYLVIIAWRDIPKLDYDIKSNKNIIIVGKDSLEKAYTPTLVTRPQFYDKMLQDYDNISQEIMARSAKE
jgi:hypothetical protein